MPDTGPNDEEDRLIAMALRALHGDDAIIVARAQIEKAGDRQRDLWMQVVQILSELSGAIDHTDE